MRRKVLGTSLGRKDSKERKKERKRKGGYNELQLRTHPAPQGNALEPGKWKEREEVLV